MTNPSPTPPSSSPPAGGQAASSASTSSIAIPIFTAVLGALLSFFASYVQFGRSIGSLEAKIPALEYRLENVESPKALRDIQSQANEAVATANKAVETANAASEQAKQWLANQPSAPIGTVAAFSAQVAGLPKGWFPCDGRTLNRTEYQELFDLIETTYGGTGNEFRLPDYQGYFLRGLDLDGKVDPDGKARKIGSVQDDELKSHSHKLKNNQNEVFGYGTREGDKGHNSRLSTGVDRDERPITFEPVGGAETRPKNIAVVWIIRAK